MRNQIIYGSKVNQLFTICILCLLSGNLTFAQNALKREFRGVWIASVANIDWPSKPSLSSEKQREEFRIILNHHKKNGINAVVVQVRPSADAFYRSELEPWSEWLTGEKGQHPNPEYDPLTFMVEEAHERGMEFHAWLNPYRAIFNAKKFYADSAHIHLDTLNNLISELIGTESSNTSGVLLKKEMENLLFLLELDTSLLIYKHPDWFLQYGNKIYFDPGIPEVQNHIASVVKDIVKRYDVDAIHMDDYFYPYRIAGVEFPDSLSFRKYGSTYSPELKDYWRRENVNAIVKKLNETIKSTKPYVKFGISPFGVWRNASVDPSGSDTKAGQTNYDDLFADVLKWQREKWIDYVIPQIYWYRGFKLADYEVLANWWNENHHGVQVYIGHGLYRVDSDSKTEAWRNPLEIPEQIELNRSLPNIHGSCFFSSKSLINNPIGVSDILKKKYYQFPALIPEMKWIVTTVQSKPELAKVKNTNSGFLLEWKNTKGIEYYAVYRFKGKRVGNMEDASNIIAIQGNTSPFFEDNNVKRFRRYTYAISAIDRLYNESVFSEAVTKRLKKVK
jgi:uncharacterized lipoprotein YddW (UPF0748 family)